MVQPLSVGNALRLFVQPPADAVLWRILRKGADTFAGLDDSEAITVYEGDDRVTVDTQFLVNEEMAFYRPFYANAAGEWTPGPTATGTPSATYEDKHTDVLSALRERLEAGLKVECERGTFATELGYIQVFTAPPLSDLAHFPVVTLHLESEQPGERGIGEDIAGDDFDAIGYDYGDAEGWLASVRLQVIGWSLNADERSALRQALRRLVIANLPVFSSQGIEQVSFEQSDVDALSGEYGVPELFQSVGQFSCLAPVRVGGRTPAVREIFVRSTNG